jgi:threonylcarbamoyladenosine tRNA methylthiotransferase MtaB
VEEARRLSAGGFAEIVLTGIHLGLYGADLEREASLADLVARIAELDSVRRLRLSSLEAPEVSNGLPDAMAHPAVCPHLHLPLQSGDDGVLDRMGRRYSARQFLHTLQQARSRLDRPAISTDVMVGFPGESRAAFERTVELCREARFSRMHVFSFSPRRGTPAAEMDDTVHSKVKKRRSARLREVASEMAREWAESFVGREVRFLPEERLEDGGLAGYTDRYVRMRMPAGQGEVGRVCRVRAVAADNTRLRGAREA